MRLRYEQLFNIGLSTAYYVDQRAHEDFLIEPTHECKKQMSRFKILHKKTNDGIALLYECSPFTNDATAFKPIASEEKFLFKVSVKNADAWYFADINNWDKDKVYYLKNALYNTPGNISIHNGPLNAPVFSRPMEFKQELPLDNAAGLLEIRDAGGALVRSIIVRAKTAAEPLGTKEAYHVNLKNFKEGLYTLRHISSGGTVDTIAFCSIDYEPGTMAIIEIRYKTGIGWTGVAPFQKYTISISSRLTEWFIDVNIRKKPIPVIVADDVAIKHIAIPPEPVRTFDPVGAPDNLNGFVQFKSLGTIAFSQKPMQLEISDKITNARVLFPLPVPTSISLQQDALNNFFTKIIVNL